MFMERIRINISSLIIGIGYMTLGEKLDTFDESKKDLQEFEKISLDYAKNVEVIVFAPPLYKYFPTKAYRDFKRATDCMYEKGVVFKGFLSQAE